MAAFNYEISDYNSSIAHLLERALGEDDKIETNNRGTKMQFSLSLL
jgi:hypothetical protein